MNSVPASRELAKENAYRHLPVHIITGFLGSGKTTLLNRLLGQAGMENTAVIVNEFGAIGIDHLLVEARTEDIMMLEGGCVCCSVRSDLVQTLEELYQRRARGDIPPFTQVVVETTGLADPAPILRTLLDDKFISDHYRLDAVVATVDSVYAAQQFSDYDEAVKQAALAHHLVLTKTDLAPPAEVAALRERLARMNPAARIHDNQTDVLSAALLFNSGSYHTKTRQIDAARWLQSAAYQVSLPPRWGRAGEGGNLPHDSYIKTFCLEYTTPLSWQVLERWLAQLTKIRGKDLLRVKGIAYTCETDLPVVIQGVQHIFQPPVTLEDWPWQPPRTQIVFITRNIPQAVVEENLEALRQCRNPQEMCEAALILLQSGGDSGVANFSLTRAP